LRHLVGVDMYADTVVIKDLSILTEIKQSIITRVDICFDI